MGPLSRRPGVPALPLYDLNVPPLDGDLHLVHVVLEAALQDGVSVAQDLLGFLDYLWL